ncbi:MAG: hypothetical protein E6I94_07865 [Chloroflexi bacterium]|nr:MAG: hypothetical protein E6I94_07865 [Chloroflexota bacterium]
MQRHLRRVLALLAAGGLLGGVVINAPTALAGDASTYVVLYRSVAVPADVAQTVSRAGGTLVASYGQIGVAIARSSSATFKSALAADSRIAAVAATDRTAIRLRDLNQDGAAAGAEANTPVSDTDPLSSYQWDMVQIHTPEAHAITGGSASVVVGDIDTGLDYTHPDLAANVSDADSANCLSGAPVQGKVAAADDNGHGTHTAGTIAAGANGIGIVGVAPNVKIAGIKAGNSDGFFFPEAVICAFMWAGTRHVDVTNNSTSRTRGCSTARTTRSSERSSPPNNARSSSPSRAGRSSSRRPATSRTTLHIPPRTARARMTRRRSCAT